MKNCSILGEHSFSNGRRYIITDTKKPYVGGEYPLGGFLIRTLFSNKTGWSYIDNSPDEKTVLNFLNAASMLKPLTELQKL